MKTKHDHLETSKLVLVSRSGFAKPALQLAALHGICAYTPEQAVRQDWMKLVGDSGMLVSRYDYTPLAMWLLMQGPAGGTYLEAGDTTEVRHPNNGAAGRLGDVVMSTLHGPEFSSRAMDAHQQDGEGTVEFEFTLNQPLLAVDIAGGEHLFSQVRVKVRALRRTSPIALNSVSWRGVPAAFGEAETALGKTVVTVIEAGPGNRSARVVADGRELPVQPLPPNKGT
jgi:hypothetical protein